MAKTNKQHFTVSVPKNSGDEPKDLISSDQDNSLVQGSDKKLYVPAPEAGVDILAVQIFS